MRSSLSSVVRRVLLAEALTVSSVKASLNQAVRSSFKGDPPSDQEVAGIVATLSEMIDKLRERLIEVVKQEIGGSSPAKIADRADEYTSMGTQWAVRLVRREIEKSKDLDDMFDEWQDRFAKTIDPIVEYYKHKKGMPPEAANIMSIPGMDSLWRYVHSVYENDPRFGFNELADPQGKFLFKVVHTYPSMCELGKGTSWCVAKNKSYFKNNSYSEKNPLLMVTDPRTGEEYLFHFGTQQFQNSHSQEAPVSFIREVFESLERTSFFSEFPNTRWGTEQFELRHTEGEVVDHALDVLARNSEKKKPDEEVYDMFSGVLLNPNVPYERVSELCKIQSATHYRSAAARNENPVISTLATFYELDDPNGIVRGDFFRFRPNPAAYEYTLDNWSFLADQIPLIYRSGVLADMVRSSSHLGAALQERLVDFFIDFSQKNRSEDDAVTRLAKDPFQLVTLGDVIRRLAPTPRKELSDFVTGRLGFLAAKADASQDWDSSPPLECARIIGFYYRQADRSQLVQIQQVLDLIMKSGDKEAEKLASDISDRIVTLLHSRQSRDGRSQRDDAIMHVIQRLDSVLQDVLMQILSKWSKKTLSFSQLEGRNVWIWLKSDMFLKIKEIAHIDAQLRLAYDRSSVKKKLSAPISSTWAGDYAQSWMRSYFLFHEGDDVQDLDETDFSLPSEGAELVKVGDSVTVRFNSRNPVEIPRPIDRSEEN
jgi:hypothetical protein